jgi:hypothetical protein
MRTTSLWHSGIVGLAARSLLLLVGAALSLSGFVAGAWAEQPRSPAAPEIWIKSGAREVDNMWTEGAAWQAVAARVKVAEFPPGNIARATDEVLQAAFRDMKRRNIALALGTGLLTRSDRCQATNEAMAAPGELEQMLEKIRRNGGDLRYIAMDEPYYFGHRDASGCHQSAAELAANVAQSVAAARRIFPNLEIGDIEVINASRPWIDELAVWADAYQAATGGKLAFMQTDIDWSELAMRNLRPLSEALQRRGIPLAIIYNADLNATTDESWEQSAESHIAEIETALAVRADIAVFDSWTPNPSHALPEATPGTLTNLALRYLRPASSLTLARQGNTIAGRLTDAQGRPVAGASVTITAVDIGARTEPTIRSVSGTVPQGAASAVIGIRVDSEGGCVCDGEAGAVIGGIRYQEKGTGKQLTVSPVNLPIAGAPASLRTLKLIPGQGFNPNLKQLPVTAGAPYTFEAPIAATASAEHAGYATVILANAQGKGLKREFLWFGPSRRDLNATATDADGRLNVTLPETAARARPEIRVAFAGNAGLRPALAIVEPQAADAATMPALVQPLSPSSSPDPRSKLILLGPRQSDFVPIFSGSASQLPWNDIAGRVNVLTVTEGFVRALPDETLARLVQDLDRRHVALGLGILPTNWFHEPPCGGGVEGYSDPGSATQTVAKLMKAGASVSLIAMDEPLWFGHYYTGKNACRSSIENVAERTAVIVKIYTAAFPNVIVGDTEPFPAVSSQPNWAADFATWTAAFHKATATPLAFLHLDFNWGDPRLNTGSAHDGSNAAAVAALAREVSTVARRNSLKVGIIYWGGGGSDAQWMDEARLHIREVEAAGIEADQLIFVSWNPYPARTFPATDPTALASLIPYYFQHHH